jgi:hypothetical protein
MTTSDPHPIHLPVPTAPPIDPTTVEGVAATRELFWHNVMREILTSLSIASAARPRPGPGQPPPAEDNLFDGRLAVLTHAGERIPIADVFPLFACGINTDGPQRALSLAVECTVFQVRTPDGQVFTMPLHEMRAFHALSPELMKALEETARRQAQAQEDGPAQPDRPFGFAAFTQLAHEPGPPQSP